MEKCKNCEHFKNDCGFAKVNKQLGLNGNYVACGQFKAKFNADDTPMQTSKTTTEVMNSSQLSLQDKIRRMHSIQRNTIDDVYDTGFFNGIEFCLSLLENREADYKPFRKE